MREIVKLQLGPATLTGIQRPGVARFGGLRYARAPVGQLRFAPPVPAPLQGGVDATGIGPIAPQLPSQLSHVMGPCEAPQSEDCLHLTVWTPGADAEQRPVVVWCHGGAWQNGGVLDWYDGEALARRGNVVVVAVNARQGPLGWLLAEGGVANVGLLDLKLAFQWVSQHIAAFGGDPAQVTAMGQSAGGVNIAALLMDGDPLLFQRAILQSAPLGRSFRSAAAALSIGKTLLHAAGAPDLEQARALPVQALLRAQSAPEVTAAVRAQADGHGLFGPVLDGQTVARFPTPLASAAATRVDVLAGWNHDEMRAFTPPGTPASDEQTEQRFAAPARQWAAQAAHAGRSAWLYRFDGPPGLPLGACHCAELPFVFGTVDAFTSAPMFAGIDPADARRLTHDMQGAWLDFVRGKPLQWAPSPQVHVFA
ncbi:carboxylesterase family protein [Ramlibacter sp. AN1015]|uniref:carboxylesterase family protein n=1 Tax=Ramlibacter sp. AN1015 TaxID=3133428 RepID=UPI0030C12A12